MGDWVGKAAIALVPLLLAGLVTLAWNNAHSLTELRTRVSHLEQEVSYLRDRAP